jgi:hypothetical protein
MESDKVPIINRRIKKMWYIFTIEFYSAIKNVICRKTAWTDSRHVKWIKSVSQRQVSCVFSCWSQVKCLLGMWKWKREKQLGDKKG